MAELKTSTGRVESVGERVLSSQISSETRSGIRSPFQRFTANGITPSRLGVIMRKAAEWDQKQWMEVAQQMEEKDGHFYSVLQTRKMAVTSLPWNVSPESEGARDMEIADFVSDVFRRRGFKQLLHDLLDGLSKGFCVTEIVWSDEIDPGRIVPSRYYYRDPRYFSYDFETQTEVTLVTDEHATYGVPLQAGKFIQHIPHLRSGKISRSGLAYTIAGLWICKAYVLKSWMAFSEVFGMPIRYGKYSEAATDDEKSALISALSALGTDASMIISKAAELDVVGINTTAHGDFYEKAERFFNQEISKVVLGQTMTTEDGSSLAQAKVHGEVRTDIRNADAQSLAETVNTFLVAPLVQFNFGPDAPLPIFSFDISEPEDLAAFSESITKFIDRGLRVRTEDIYQRFGLARPEDDEEVLGAAQVDPFGDESASGDGGEGDDGDGDDPEGGDPEDGEGN